MATVRIPWRDLQQKPDGVLTALNAGNRVEITRRGIPVAVMTAPDPAEVTLDALVSAGELDADWRERHDRFMQRVRSGPQTVLPQGSPSASATVIALRDDGPCTDEPRADEDRQ